MTRYRLPLPFREVGRLRSALPSFVEYQRSWIFTPGSRIPTDGTPKTRLDPAWRSWLTVRARLNDADRGLRLRNTGHADTSIFIEKHVRLRNVTLLGVAGMCHHRR
jgi:hypothetical protein